MHQFARRCTLSFSWGNYPARIRTLNEGTKIPCVTITPPGKRSGFPRCSAAADWPRETPSAGVIYSPAKASTRAFRSERRCQVRRRVASSRAALGPCESRHLNGSARASPSSAKPAICPRRQSRHSLILWHQARGFDTSLLLPSSPHLPICPMNRSLALSVYFKHATYLGDTESKAGIAAPVLRRLRRGCGLRRLGVAGNLANVRRLSRSNRH